MRVRTASAITAIAAGVIAAGSLCAAPGHGGGDAAPLPHAGPPHAELFTAEGGPVAPGDPPPGVTGTAPGDCAVCHAEIAAEWAGSAHARAWTDPIFQAEYRLTRQAFCRHCHAPLARDVPEPGPAASTVAVPIAAPDSDASPGASGGAPAARGIDCAVCHVRDGHVLGVRGGGVVEHAAQRDARLATTAFCARCHQFDFPRPGPGERVRYHPGRPLQNTVVEWSQSRYADRPCQDCHMPRAGEAGGSHRSHAFRTLDDPALMARAVRVSGQARRRGGAVRVTVVIAPGEIGHAFPTGDMFRRVVLTVRAGAARRCEVLMRYFAQTITDDRSGHLLGQVDDTRVPPPGAGPPASLDFELVDPGATEVAWSIDLFRLSPEEALDRGLDPAAVERRVQSGRLAIRR